MCSEVTTEAHTTTQNPIPDRSTPASIRSHPDRKSSIGVLSPRLSLETSPSASASKGFLISATRVTSTSRKFKQTISSKRRLARPVRCKNESAPKSRREWTRTGGCDREVRAESIAAHDVMLPDLESRRARHRPTKNFAVASQAIGHEVIRRRLARNA